MSIFTTEQRAQVETAIRTAEAATSAEFLCVVARATDTYMTVPLLLAAVLGIALPPAALHLISGWPLVVAHGAGLALLQLACFAVLALLGTRPAIAARLSPDAVRRRRAARCAAAVFLERGLAGVRARNGVLLFVALAERHVEIIADRGLFERVDPQRWTAVVDAFTTEVRRGNVAHAYVAALARLAPILAEAYPRAADDINEIPDRLVELD